MGYPFADFLPASSEAGQNRYGITSEVLSTIPTDDTGNFFNETYACKKYCAFALFSDVSLKQLPTYSGRLSFATLKGSIKPVVM